jgi:hypothetical protein
MGDTPQEVVERRAALVIMEECETCKHKSRTALLVPRQAKLAIMCPVCEGRFTAWIQENQP